MALLIHGFLLSFLFMGLHENVHGTAFRSTQLSRMFQNLFGFLTFRPPTHYYYYHWAHHRHTGDKNKGNITPLKSNKENPINKQQKSPSTPSPPPPPLTHKQPYNTASSFLDHYLIFLNFMILCNPNVKCSTSKSLQSNIPRQMPQHFSSVKRIY